MTALTTLVILFVVVQLDYSLMTLICFYMESQLRIYSRMLVEI